MSNPNPEQARAAYQAILKDRRKSPREFVRTLAECFTHDDMRAIMEKVVERAKMGDRDAMAFVSKHCLDGGKVSIADVLNPPMIRRTR